ncbi:MAG: PSD1 and planctomycete cytochrome C domain-containing protein [Gemmataceae bacterium]
MRPAVSPPAGRHVLSGLVLAALVATARPVLAADRVDFARDVLPILSDRCFACHGPDKATRKGGLRLDTKEGALGGDAPAVVPGKSGASELIRRLVTTEAREAMPPAKFNKPLSAAQIELLRRWVDAGAPWGKHWAFEAPRRPPLPAVKERGWVRTPIDAFILARLEGRGLRPSSEASRETLIRRVSLDLTGLPPTLKEIDDFLADPASNAYERLVDRLLASPRYGERMAWDWLDAARYADSNGYQGDGERTMWPWRDWVVRAFNDNLPYDRFTVDQLAGDLLPKPTRDQILATAFNRNHMINGEGGRIAEENRVEYVVDQTETVGTIWLGLTLTCARCHDHKYDPVSRKDYYGLFAFFNQTPVNGGNGSGQTPPVIDFGTPEQERRRADTARAYDALVKTVSQKEAQLRTAGMTMKDGKYATTLPQLIESALRKGPNDRADQNIAELTKFYRDREPEYVKQLAELRKLRRARDEAANALPRVMVMQDMPKPRETFILTRGAYDKREGKVEADVPAGVVPLPPGAPRNRLGLARWLVAADNPLTARVTVNRFWQQFFGTGLVKTTEDFGVQGKRPSHPELLDWLAVEFRESGWDVKHLVKLIVTSATYRQTSKVTPALREIDPDNRLLARGPRSRLPSWLLRDQALAVSGLLSEGRGGPSVNSYQPAGIWEEATFGNKAYRQDRGDALYRRSLYVFWRRIVGPTVFFDTPNRQVCAVKTVVTNTPLHALTTLNDVTYVEAARALAERAILGASSDADRLALAFRRTTGRRPTSPESTLLVAALEKQRRLFAADPNSAKQLLKVGESPRHEKIDPVEHAAFTAVCTLLLNLDETLTRQ